MSSQHGHAQPTYTHAENAQPKHVAVICTAAACGLRFPIPVGHERHGSCPLCEAPTVDSETYPAPVARTAAEPDGPATVGVLDNIRSAMNVGTMLRTADGARLGHMHLCGLTPQADHAKVTKTSLGAELVVPWTYHRDATTCAKALQADGWTLWAIELSSTSTPFQAINAVPERVALIVGNERAGVDPALLRIADRHLHLPMAGAKTSLNVGVAFGVAAYGVLSIRSRAAAAKSQAD